MKRYCLEMNTCGWKFLVTLIPENSRVYINYGVLYAEKSAGISELQKREKGEKNKKGKIVEFVDKYIIRLALSAVRMLFP